MDKEQPTTQLNLTAKTSPTNMKHSANINSNSKRNSK